MRPSKPAKEVEGMEPLLSVRQLADLTGFSVSFIRRAQNSRAFPYYKLGGLVRFRMSDFKAWLDSRRIAG